MPKPDTLPNVSREGPEDDRSPELVAADDASASGISRRTFIKGVGGGAAATVALSATSAPVADAQEDIGGVRVANITLNINGETQVVSGVEPRATLLDVLRNRLEHTGAKPVCERASCGACSVLFDGKPVYACSILAMDAEGHEIVTVEGLLSEDSLHPVQQAFPYRQGTLISGIISAFLIIWFMTGKIHLKLIKLVMTLV